MKIYLKVFATLAQKLSESLGEACPDGFKSGSDIELDMPVESSIAALLDRLDLQNKGWLLVLVNGQVKKKDYRMCEGDQIGIFPPIGGG